MTTTITKKKWQFVCYTKQSTKATNRLSSGMKYDRRYAQMNMYVQALSLLSLK